MKRSFQILLDGGETQSMGQLIPAFKGDRWHSQ